MKIKQGFVLREILGEKVVVPEGPSQINFNRLLRLNESAAFLFEQLQSMTDFDAAQAADLLAQHYGIEHDLALTDATRLINEFDTIGILE